ncbi:MAG: Txe/YoeB family addiction module toxin [Coriobacteriia bacterium]|nr:Txe/YoeB family addiction module toxin [Coriobacteriia bacterium]
MDRKLVFNGRGWDDYTYWQTQDRKTIKRINKLFADIDRNGNEGIGSPEQLSEDLAGWWSRRIDDKNRLVYRLRDNDAIEVVQCRGHYDDK